MKSCVLRIDDRTESLLTIAPSTRRRLRDLGLAASFLVSKQDSALWARASDKEFLKQIAKGAALLGEIGCAKDCIIRLRDCGSHYAFMACLFLSSQADALTTAQRQGLRLALLLLSECCPVDLPIRSLPPISELHQALRQQGIMRKHYPVMERSGVIYVLTLADALRLLDAVQQLPPISLVPLVIELRKTTEGLRVALRKARSAGR
jgi:hypothetical protein